jgi:hypothetical protein
LAFPIKPDRSILPESPILSDSLSSRSEIPSRHDGLCATLESPKSTAIDGDGENLANSLDRRPPSASPVHFTNAQSP